MRHDMGRVTSENRWKFHTEQSPKWGRRLSKDEYEADDHGPTRITARYFPFYRLDDKWPIRFAPLGRYLRRQVGRPWDEVWSEVAQQFDDRSWRGWLVLEHVWRAVSRDIYLDEGGQAYELFRFGLYPASDFFVHPASGLLCYGGDGNNEVNSLQMSGKPPRRSSQTDREDSNHRKHACRHGRRPPWAAMRRRDARGAG